MPDLDRNDELYQAMRDFALRVLKGTCNSSELSLLPVILKYLLPPDE